MKKFESLRTELVESVEDLQESSQAMPPNILILRRISVRQFPGRTMVALYQNDRLGLSFSIPYSGDTPTVVTPVEVDEAHKIGDTATSQEKEIERYDKTAALWKNRKQRWSAYKAAAPKADLQKEDSNERTLGEAATRTAQYSPMPGNQHWHNAIPHLQRITKFETNEPMRHKDTQRSRVDPTTAKALLTVHDSLSDKNKKTFVDHLEHSREKFNKMVDFAWSQVK
jgi:hypothetical protein